MIKNYSIKVVGPAGYGIMETGRILGRALVSLGFKVLVYPEYPSRIRGGDNVSIVSFSSSFALPEDKNDLIIVLGKENFSLHRQELKSKGFFILDEKNEEERKNNVLALPLTKIALDSTGWEITRNMVSLGVAFGLLGFPLDVLKKQIETNLKDKGRVFVDKNLIAVKEGSQLAQSLGLKKIISLPKKEEKNRLLLSGNDALVLGAIEAKCSHVAIYPMTPINSILTDLSKKQKETKMVIFQPEDEIAGINWAIGASFAGKRSLVATSGGGFSLMVEGFALAGATETPLVVIEGMRAGPSTGMATWTSQEDLSFLIQAGNGEFPRIILTPGDPEEAYRLIFLAFNLADIYQMPVVVVSDKYLSESAFSVSGFNKKKLGLKIDRGRLLKQRQKRKYQRYQLEADGISPRAFPGQVAFLTNSYVHDEAGFTIEDGAKRLEMKQKIFKKITSLGDKPGTMLYGNKEAKLTLVGWGSTKQALFVARQNLEDQGFLVNHLHFFRPWPFPNEAKEILTEAKEVVVVENNSEGQLAGLISKETGITIGKKILKDDGRPFFVGEIEKQIL